MPRNGSGVYSKPTGTAAVSGTTISSADYNTTIDDLVTDANAARPIVAGGTAGDTLADAVTNLNLTRATYGGTANAITLTTAETFATLPTGVSFRFRASAANTGSATIAVDGGSAITCKTITGVNLPSGYIRTDADTTCYYDGTNFIVDRVIENGSGSNGEWTRWADGTQIVWDQRTLTFNSAASVEVVWTYEQAFSAPPDMQATYGNPSTATPGADALGAVRANAVSATATTLILTRITGTTDFVSGDTVPVYAKATGRWF